MVQSPLALFVPRVGTNYADNTLATNNPAIFAYSFYRTSDFHSFKNTFRTGDSDHISIKMLIPEDYSTSIQVIR
jgi:hypothetical protein